jgi:DMSO/TMAO reductase YedYZ heme-binding membrane subunit
MNLINEKLDNLIEILNKNKYSKILIDVFINWNIPFFNLIKKYLVFISILWLIIFINPKLFKDFWEYSYNLLIFILLISPISKIFPKFKILNKILILRREIWIIIWFFLLAHLIWFFLTNNIWVIEFIKSEIFNFWDLYFWWLWWTIFAIFPFITSNNLSQKILKRKWKLFQYATYLFFIFTVFHVYTLKWEIEELWVLFIWIILKIIEFKKVIILK